MCYLGGHYRFQIQMGSKEEFIDTRDFPDAYRLSGGYTQKNGVIELKLKIKGIKESEYTHSAPTKTELIAKVIEIVEGIK